MTYNPEKYEPFLDWYESTFDDAKAIGAMFGLDIDNIYFSGFWSQGDGASFTGSYAYAKGASKAVRDYAPLDTELHAIVDALSAAQRGAFYSLTATCGRGALSNHYSHSNTMSVDVESTLDETRALPEDAVTNALRLFADWIYDRLEHEYEYQQAWQMASAWSDLADVATNEKAAARQLIRDMRSQRAADVPASICNALREAVRRHLADMRDALQERADIAENFHYRKDGKSVDVAAFAA